MSKVAIQGNASGTGTFSIVAPNSNNDRTLVLPDEAGTVLTSGTALSSFPSGFANGITEADMWALSSDKTADNSVITSGWARPTTSGFNYIGTGLSQTSGVFSFPSTGIYLVQVNARFSSPSSSGANKFAFVGTQVTRNNGGSWSSVVYAITNTYDNSTYASSVSQILVDITDLTNHKVQFITNSENGNVTVQSSLTLLHTYFSVIRLGDT